MTLKTESTGLKNNRRNIIAILVYLAIILLIWAGLTAMPASELVRPPRIDNDAIFDLRNSDIDGYIQYLGSGWDWDSWPERFYSPDDFKTGTVGEPKVLFGEDYEYYQFFTHKITLLVVPGTTYGISIRSSDYAMRMFVYGEQAALVGLPGTTRAEAIPRTNFVVYYFTPQTDEVDIIVHTSNFVHNRGGTPPRLYISSVQNIERRLLSQTFMSFLIIGSLLTSGLYHLALFIMNRKRKTELIFSICCLLFLVMSIEPVLRFFPEYNWHIMFRVEYFVFYASFGMNVLLFDFLSSRLLNKWIGRVYYGICSLFILSIFVFDTVLFSTLIRYFYPIGIAMLLYGLVRMGMALKEGKLHNLLAFIGLFVMAFFIVNDVLLHTQIPHLLNLPRLISYFGIQFTTAVGAVFFVFCYALLLALRYADTEREAFESSIREKAVTEEKLALENLSQMKTGFLEDIKHEVRNPLHVISLGVDYVSKNLNQKSNEADAIKVLATMQNEALRLGKMVEGMVELANMEGSKTSRKKIDFAALITSCAENYQLKLASNQNMLQTKIPEDLPFVYGESEQLTRVIINLLSNANDSVTNGKIYIEAFNDKDYNIVRILDNGCGIDPGLMSRLFERGVSGKGHDGFGLPICKTIIEAHGGELRVESGELKVESRGAEAVAGFEFISGTVVNFTIPVYGGQGN